MTAPWALIAGAGAPAVPARRRPDARNVAAAIDGAEADGVDVASGVETRRHPPPQVLREFGENIFWYEVEEIQDSGLVKGRLQRSPKDGTDSRVLASITGATTLATDDKFVSMTPATGWCGGSGGSRRIGNNVITSMVVLEPAGTSLAIADDEAYVYWSIREP